MGNRLMPEIGAICHVMKKSAAKSTLYRLIETGHLARQAMLVPLLESGLEPGDDALLFGLIGFEGATDAELSDLTGLGILALGERLDRLADAGILMRLSVGSKLAAGAKLTEKGREITDILEGNWQQLEEALIGELDHKKHKGLRKILKRFVTLLDH